MVAVGARAPDVVLVGADGAPLPLGQFRGRPLLLWFYPRDDTAGCTREALAFDAVQGDFAALDMAMLGVSRDGPAAHACFAAKHGLSVPVASDPEAQAATAFGVWVEKLLYGRRSMGIERATFLIDADGHVAATWRRVRVPGHAETVLEAARECFGAT